jgi:murein DD-endopeptidase MepM/ murein hydrolase activator NlpD
MSSGIIETIKRVALNVYEASNPVKVMFGTVLSTNPVKIEIGTIKKLVLTEEFLVLNGDVFEGDRVTLIRIQGGQKFVVLGSRTEYIESTVYSGGSVPNGTSGSYQYPFTGGYTITSAFGVKRGSRTHKGVDLVGKNSKLIYPISSGVVVTQTYNKGGYGNYVVIDHGNNIWSLYAHFSKVYVKVGQTVNNNTILGVEGSTGNSTGSHLHLEVRKGSNSSSNTVNPITFLNNN